MGGRQGMALSCQWSEGVQHAFSECLNCLGNLTRYIYRFAHGGRRTTRNRLWWFLLLHVAHGLRSAKLYGRVKTLEELKRIADNALVWDRCVRTDAFCLAWRKPSMKQCPLLGPSDAAKWWKLRTLRDEVVPQPEQGTCTKNRDQSRQNMHRAALAESGDPF